MEKKKFNLLSALKCKNIKVTISKNVFFLKNQLAKSTRKVAVVM
jgi:hypothetical protein